MASPPTAQLGAFSLQAIVDGTAAQIFPRGFSAAPSESEWSIYIPVPTQDDKVVFTVQIPPDRTPASAFWVQFQMILTPGSNVVTEFYLRNYPVSYLELVFGINSVMFNNTYPAPPPCFSGRTRVWCVDESGGKVQHAVNALAGEETFCARDAAGTPVCARGQVFSHTPAHCKLYTIAPGVEVTGDHMVLLPSGERARMLRPVEQWVCAACKAEGVYGGAVAACPRCAAVTVAGFEQFVTKDSTFPAVLLPMARVYHIRLEDPTLALVVGDAFGAGREILAEGYRSDASILLGAGWRQLDSSIGK
jgi:hypothetical protein